MSDDIILLAHQLNIPGIPFPVPVFLDVHPELYPHGVEVSAHRPGELEMVGQQKLERGSMLILLPPVLASNARAQAKANYDAAAARTQAAGG